MAAVDVGAPGVLVTSSAVRLAVLGRPIAHSMSPALHSAAYAALGLDWHYGRFDVGETELASFLAERGAGWRGLSLTMPLKSAVIPHCATVTADARLAGAVNTITFRDASADAAIDGDNTDIGGAVRALDEAGVGAGPVVVLGAGNTASSLIVAAASRGPHDLTILARAPERARHAVELAERCSMRARVLPLADAAIPAETALVINTIPGGAMPPVVLPPLGPAGPALFEAVYDPWPTPLASAWLDAGAPVVTGLDLLVHQAVLQVRRFVRPADGARTITDTRLVEVMRGALGRA